MRTFVRNLDDVRCSVSGSPGYRDYTGKAIASVYSYERGMTMIIVVDENNVWAVHAAHHVTIGEHHD